MIFFEEPFLIGTEHEDTLGRGTSQVGYGQTYGHAVLDGNTRLLPYVQVRWLIGRPP